MNDPREKKKLIQRALAVLSQQPPEPAETAHETPAPMPVATLAGIPLPVLGIIAAHGVRDVATARRLMQDDPQAARARELLATEWRKQCPRAAVIDAAIASQDGTEMERALARANRELLEAVHTATCSACQRRLDDLSRALDRLNDVDGLVSVWTLTLTPVPDTVGSRGERGERDLLDRHDVYNIELAQPEVFQALTGRQRGEAEWPPRIRAATLRSAQGNTIVEIRLALPALLHRSVAQVTVIARAGDRVMRVPLDVNDRTDSVFHGKSELPAGKDFVPSSFDLEVRRARMEE